jgi:hypothetical protein
MLGRVEVKQTKTLRFDAVVAQSGRPELTTLWAGPDADPEFRKARSARRVATLVQHNVGAKKDYALVGFVELPHAAYLVFPKTLPFPHESKIVGIKYERLAAPERRGRVVQAKPEKPPAKAAMTQPAAKKAPPAAPEPRRFSYQATVALTAVQRVTVAVEARTAAEAARFVASEAGKLAFDPSRATLTRKVSKPRRSR